MLWCTCLKVGKLCLGNDKFGRINSKGVGSET